MTISVCIVVLAISLTFLVVSKNSDNPRTRLASGLSSAVMVFASASLGGIHAAHAFGADQSWEVESTTPMAAMSNASEIDGKTGLFVTRIDEKNVLRYVEKTADGGYELSEINADGVTIYEDADKGSAQMEVVACTREGVERFSPLHSCGSRTRIHVPKGSVSSDFEVNPGR